MLSVGEKRETTKNQNDLQDSGTICWPKKGNTTKNQNGDPQGSVQTDTHTRQ